MTEKAFDESKHPRDEKGRWSEVKAFAKKAARVSGAIALVGAAGTAHAILQQKALENEVRFRKRQTVLRAEDHARYMHEIDMAVNKVKGDMLTYEQKQEAQRAAAAAKTFRNPGLFYNTMGQPMTNDQVEKALRKQHATEQSNYDMRGFWNPPGGKR